MTVSELAAVERILDEDNSSETDQSVAWAIIDLYNRISELTSQVERLQERVDELQSR